MNLIEAQSAVPQAFHPHGRRAAHYRFLRTATRTAAEDRSSAHPHGPACAPSRAVPAPVATGRTATVTRLRAHLPRAPEELPLDAATEVLVLLEPAVATFERHAALELERAPAADR